MALAQMLLGLELSVMKQMVPVEAGSSTQGPQMRQSVREVKVGVVAELMKLAPVGSVVVKAVHCST